MKLMPEGSSAKDPQFQAEEQQLEWCQSILDEDQFRQCEEEAWELAAPIIYEQEAAELAVKLLVRRMIRSFGPLRAGESK